MKRVLSLALPFCLVALSIMYVCRGQPSRSVVEAAPLSNEHTYCIHDCLSHPGSEVPGPRLSHDGPGTVF
jgi:hypothetical protein